MDDNAIIALYFARDPAALAATQERYGSYCSSIAYQILHSTEDAQECLNDTLLRAWNAIPPTRPRVFRTFLGRITRNLSLQRYRSKHAQKRAGDEVALALDELEPFVSGGTDPMEIAEAKELQEAIGRFLGTLRKADREIFLARYWFFAPVREIAARFGDSEARVKTSLYRTRQKLHTFLEQEELL